MRRSLALLSAVLGLVGLCAAPASAAPVHRAPVVSQAASTVSTSSSSITLTWTNPHLSSFRSTTVRYASGTHAPRTVTSGHLAGHVGRHTRSLHLTRLAAGHHYAFAIFPVLTHHRLGHRLTVVGLVAPAAPTHALPFVTSAGLKVTWTNPHTPTFRRVVVRYAAGSAAPSAPSHGHGVALPTSRPSSTVVPHLLTNSRYSVSVFALDYRGGWSTPSVVRFTTPPAPEHAGTYAGTVTDAAGHRLAGAVIEALSASGTDRSATSGPDGTFALPLAADQYLVLVAGQHITGGSGAVGGYLPDFAGVVIRPGRTTTAHISLRAGGALTGRFTDRSGHPLAGVVPTLAPVGPYVGTTTDDGSLGGVDFQLAGATTGDASGPDGTFVIRGVDPAGANRLCADASGTVSGGSSDTAGYLSSCATRTSIASLGAVTSAPDLMLEAGNGTTVSGTVSGAHHQLPDAFVFLASAEDGQDGPRLIGHTDALGHYAVRGVPAGTYQVCADSGFAPSFAPTGFQEGCSKPVTVASAPAVVNVSLPLAAALTGTVRGPGAHRVAGAGIDAENDDEGGNGAGTGSQGQYTLTGLAAGSYSVCVTPPTTPTSLLPTGVQPGCVPGDTTAIAGRNRTGLDVTLPAGSAVSGTVTDAQGQPADAVVEVESVDSNSDQNNGFGAFTDSHGHYVLAGLPADTYRVCFQAISVTSGRARCAAHTVTTRIGHTVTHVDAHLPAETTLRITVTDASAGPVAGADATALTPCAGKGDQCGLEPLFDPAHPVSVDASFTTDANGQVLLGGIAPGTYAVCVFGYDGTTASGGSPTGYVDTCTGHTFTITVTAGGTTDITVQLPTAGAVTGTVTDGGGNPVGDVAATVSHSAATSFDPRNSFLIGSGLDSPLAGGNSGHDGTYTVIGVQPGAQTVCFVTDSATGGWSPSGYRNQCVGAAPGSTTGGTPVSVTAGATTTGVNIALSPAGAITGTVKHGSTPLANGTAIAVVFQGHDVNAEVDEAETDVSGHFRIVGLEPGTYTLCVDTEDFGGECWRNVTWDDDNDPPLARATPITVSAGSVVSGIDVALR